ncbi:Fc.00g034420.m01.CDS01 [Cosmosporella sp. VM-42]
MKFSKLIPILFPIAAVNALSQAEAQSRLEAVGIYAHSSGGCTTKSNPSCTSYEGIREDTVEGAITLKRACGCSVTITGGTETGHASGTYSHSNGYKLDFAKASGLNSYITNTFTKIANRGDGYPQWKAASGNIYCDEGNHWDVTFYTNGH